MKFYEAIREGCRIKTEQTFDEFYNDAETASCALGAAADAIGIDPDDGDISRHFSETAGLVVSCPACKDQTKIGIVNLIPHINDDHKWSRESIADWVESMITGKPL